MKNDKETTRTTETVRISRAEYEVLKARNKASENNSTTAGNAVEMVDVVMLSGKAYDEILRSKKAVEDENARLLAIQKWLEEQLICYRNGKFGHKSEKASEEVIGQLSLLFDEPETYACLEEIQEEKVTVEKHERTVKRKEIITVLGEELPDSVEVETEEHTLSDEERKCPTCGADMELIGKDRKRTIKIIPAKVVIHEDVYDVYTCKKCSQETGQNDVIKAPRKPEVYPGSAASSEAIAYLMTEKFVMASPLYRIEQYFARIGIPLSRQTMSNWIMYASNTWLKPLFEELKLILKAGDIIHADETTLRVLHEAEKEGNGPNSKCYMWVYRSGKYEKMQVVLYEYKSNRQGKNPREFLDGFHKYLQTDGFDGYNLVEDVIHVGCMAHLKRKFHEAVEVLPKGKKTGAAVEGEAYCAKLFKIEQELADLTPEERYKERLKLEKPILDEFLSWGNNRTAAPKSKLGIALTYLQNQGTYLSNYLLDGRLEISNNLAERSVKPFVIARKNFLFSNTALGASASAVTFSIIETAKANGLDPFKYLTFIFNTAPTLDQEKEHWAAALLPDRAPENCKV